MSFTGTSKERADKPERTSRSSGGRTFQLLKLYPPKAARRALMLAARREGISASRYAVRILIAHLEAEGLLSANPDPEGT